jgi:hypothetical protein
MPVDQSNILTSLAVDIAELQQKANQATRQGLEHFKKIGEKLCEAKKEIGHGNFIAWAIEATGLKKSRNNELMRLHKKWPEIEPQLSTAVDFSVKGVLTLVQSRRFNQAAYECAKELLDAWKATLPDRW